MNHVPGESGSAYVHGMKRKPGCPAGFVLTFGSGACHQATGASTRMGRSPATGSSFSISIMPPGGEALAGNPSEGNPFQASEFDPNTFSANAQIAEGAGQGLVVWFSQAAKAGQSLVLNLAGTAGEGLKALIDGQAVAAPRIG